MLRKFFIIGSAMVALAGCQSQDEAADTKPYVQADLALALMATVPNTRMATKEVLETGSRPIQDLTIVPFSRQGVITTEDRPRYYEASGSTPYDNKDGGNKRFYYCQSFSFMPGVASFLVYGRAETVKKAADNTVVDKPANGSLLMEMDGQSLGSLPRMVIPATMKFKPEPMLNSTTAPAEAECIAKYLTAIADVDGWKNTNDSWLKAVYLNFINQGNEETSVLAGSACNVKAYVNKLYQTMANHTFTEGTMEKAIAQAVMNKITKPNADYSSGSVTMKVTVNTETKEVTSLGTCDSYPNNYNLPDGAAVLLWTKKTETSNYEFVPQTETTTMASINTISRFAYPAELYYYANSRIKTNNEEVTANIYDTETKWDDVLSKYTYDNSVVTTSTKAVAIKDPLQYGVAKLSAKVYATSGSLPDANGTTVPVGPETFPITGIIIDKQRPVGFDFKPLSAEEADVKFVYDSHLNTNEGNNYCLSTTESEKPFLHTLVLQNCENEDVTVILELQNNSGQDFKGENGTVYDGTKFYLVGRVEKPTYSEVDDDYKKRVFTQDRTTTVGMKISSLAHAYNVLPNILAGRLEIGVQINTDWEAATPTTVIFQ